MSRGGADLLLAALLLAVFLPARPSGALPPAPRTPASPPRLEAVLRLADLEALLPPAPGPPAGGTLTGLAASADGVVLGFTDRFLSLGPFFQVDWRTVRDLRPQAAAGLQAAPFVASHLALTPLGEIICYDAESGEAIYVHPLTGGAGRYPTGLAHPTQFAGLPSGGFALLQGNRVALFTRRTGGLERRDIALPAGVYTALAARDGATLLAFDWQQRRVIAVNPAGDVVGSVALQTDPAALPFAQVLAVGADGGLLLGGPGGLWKFSAAGEPLWRLDGLPVGPSGTLREAFPAVYMVAAAPGGVFYVADFPSGRVLRFRDARAEDGSVGVRTAAPPADPRPDRAAALDTLSRKLEEQLLLPEAEGACAEALELYRLLRREDPVDPRFPRRLQELTARRQALRAMLFEEPLLEARLPARLELGREQPLTMINRSGTVLEDLELTVLFSGVPYLEPLRLARARLAAGQALTVPLCPRPAAGWEAFFAPLREDAGGRVSIRVSLRQRGETRTLYLAGPVSIGLQ